MEDENRYGIQICLHNTSFLFGQNEYFLILLFDSILACILPIELPIESMYYQTGQENVPKSSWTTASCDQYN